jgi:hypothetical protein
LSEIDAWGVYAVFSTEEAHVSRTSASLGKKMPPTLSAPSTSHNIIYAMMMTLTMAAVVISQE